MVYATHQIESVGTGVALKVLTDRPVVAPRRYHANAVLKLNNTEQLTDVSMAQLVPRNHLSLKTLRNSINNVNAIPIERTYLHQLLLDILDHDLPQNLDRDLFHRM